MGSPVDVVLVGRPWAPIGVGEVLRVAFRAFRSVGAHVRVHDIYRQDPDIDAKLRQEFGPYLTDDLSPSINIFHINGDEIAEAFRRLRPALPPASYNIIWPMWELSRYPGEWASEVARFDEVWVASRFTEESLRAAVSIPVSRMPLGVEPRVSRFFSRRYFGIPEAPFVFLFMFDFLSFVERKNPYALLEAFRRLRQRRPAPPVRLVIKLGNASLRPIDQRSFLNTVAEAGDDVIVIDRLMTEEEVKNLIRCCDCFVSLHRSEGFGFSLAEAMYFRKPVIATGYSSNLEFMSEDTSRLIPYRLVPVPEGSYPHGEGQSWAEPDIDAAVDTMARLLDDRAYCRALGDAASRHLRVHFSYRAAGLRYLSRIAEITATARPGTPHHSSVSRWTPAVALAPPTALSLLAGIPKALATVRDQEALQLHCAAQALSQEEWFAVVRASLDPAYRYRGMALPGFIDEERQRNFVGSSGLVALDEAIYFLRVVHRYLEQFAIPIRDAFAVLDFGCGWGRFTRFLLRYAAPERIFAVDVDREMIALCGEHFQWGQFLHVDPFPPTALPAKAFDLVLAYSVFSHLSEAAANAWIGEFARIMKPGALVVLTTQRRDFIAFCQQMRESGNRDHGWYVGFTRAFLDVDQAYRDYDAGRYVWASTGGGNYRDASFYGEALIPRAYIERHWQRDFELLAFADEHAQAMIVLRRRNLG